MPQASLSTPAETSTTEHEQLEDATSVHHFSPPARSAAAPKSAKLARIAQACRSSPPTPCLQEQYRVSAVCTRVKAKARAHLQAKRAARSEPIQPWKDWNWDTCRRKTPARASASHPTSSRPVVEQQAGPAVQEIDESDEEDGAGNAEGADQKEVAEGHSPHSSDGRGDQQVIVASHRRAHGLAKHECACPTTLSSGPSRGCNAGVQRHRAHWAQAYDQLGGGAR